jgi:hypothetical protein
MELIVVFCADPFDPRKPDPAFRREAEAAQRLGIPRIVFDHDVLERSHDAATATKRIQMGEPVNAVYRGWMVRAEDYRALYDALSAKNVRLVNTPAEYSACHHIPEIYPHVAKWMAKTVWIKAKNGRDDGSLAAALASFGSNAVVLKDWVKSQASGYWEEACFISDASDTTGARRIVDRFLELQGESLTGGLVFRAYVPLAKEAEWRAFVVDGDILGCWPRSSAESDTPPGALVSSVARALPSRFATADFARKEDGGWLLLETGDGQVSELPEIADADAFLSSLREELAAS